jgi:hypothetical protein
LKGQSWVTLPNGELGFITTLTTTGFFQCGDPFFMIGSCQVSANGNSLTLGSGGAFMTLTFLGLSQSIMATNIAQPVYVGSVTKSFSGSGQFLFPTSTNSNVPLFFLYIDIGLQAGTPLWGSVWGAAYLPLSRTSIPRGSWDTGDGLGWGIIPSPEPYTYGSVALDPFWGATMTVTGEPLQIYANAGIAPEPATIWLTGTGLAVVAASLRRRRKRPDT